MTTKPYRIQVFGKAGCDKCKTLNQRLDRLLGKPGWEQFDKEYGDILTIDGLVPFCEAECINPQQIPAILVTRFDEDTNAYEMIPNPAPGETDDICGASKLYHVIGLQTDYATGSGVITPKMITHVLALAREAAPVPVEETAEEAPADEAVVEASV